MVPFASAEATMVHFLAKRAVTCLSSLMVTAVTGFVPEASPLHSAKYQGFTASAERVTAVPAVYSQVVSGVSVVPAGFRDTVPSPETVMERSLPKVYS
jgi:hypothetical protein